MKKPVFLGCATAIITPSKSGTVDLEAFRTLIDHQIQNGIHALVVCGTTGEAATMSYVERMRTIETAVNHVNGRIPVIAGTGSNSTESAIALSRDVAELGVDALLIVTPYYNKATQHGLIQHFNAIADNTTTPIILYNVPGRTGVSCTAETYAALSAHPNIVGVKEASGNMALVQKTREVCPDDFYIWSGNDEDTAAVMLLGGSGVISVVSNILPGKMVELTNECLNGDFRKAGAMQLRLRKLIDVLFREVNPIPVKTALSMMGLCEEQFRLPLCEMSPENKAELALILKEYQLI